ncbi:MAG TPA: sensor histidine kinase [Anaerovoracaceae bacterium]|nr:sensor histidine kinase [Anaerovoracaceae bacterium]
MDKIIFWKRKESIYSSLLVYFILFALIPTLIINFLYYGLSSKYINEATAKLGNETILKVCSELDYFFESIIRVGDVAVDNQRIQDVLRMNFGNDIALKYTTDLEVDAELYFANFLQPKIEGLSVLGENGGEYKSYDRAFLNQVHSQQSWYQKIKESKGYVWFPPHKGQFANVSDSERESFVSCGRAVVDKATGKVTGVLLIDINEKIIRDIISAELGESGYLLILDEKNNVIMSSIGMEGRLIDIDKRINVKEGDIFPINIRVQNGEEVTTQSVVATYQESPVTGWKIMGIIPISQLNKWGNILLLFTGMLTVVIVGLAIYTAIHTSNRVVKPIRNLRVAMGKVEEGDLGVNIDINSHYDEVNQLARSFNVMVAKVKGLMSDIYEDQRNLRKAELKALQSQINPHFLYNTLDSILWLNRSGKKEAVESMVEALTTFFRIGISRGKEIITVEEEVKHLESYLMIQNIRYGDKFQYSIDVEAEALGCMVPKLILQPLAENSIYHGVKLKKENCIIYTEIMIKDDMVKILMSDTGVGMSKEKVAQLNKAMKGESVPGLELYGVKNIQERIKILLGDEANILYESKEGEGTVVTITLPIITTIN